MGKDFIVSLKPGTDRANDFLKVFGRLDVNVESPIPQWGLMPGYVEPQLHYMLDLKMLTKGERRRLIEFLSERFSMSIDEVMGDLNLVGVPILAEDCFLIIENPQRWV